ncbi:MAG: hypothetical protein ACSLE6_09185 [Mycobacterium sp.]
MSAPPVVRYAGFAVLAEGIAALIFALVVVIHTAGGATNEGISNGYGFASWFVVIGAGVVAGGWALISGRRWGRGLGVFINLILLGVAWYASVGSHQPLIGIAAGVFAIAVLALLFSGPAVRWQAGEDDSPS